MSSVRDKRLNLGMHVAVSERGAYSGNSMGMCLLAPHARYQAPRTYGFKHLQHQDLEARSLSQHYPTSPALVQQVQEVEEPLVKTTEEIMRILQCCMQCA